MQLLLKDFKKHLAQIVVTQWKKPNWILILLPFSAIYYCLSFLFFARKSNASNVWVVGNAIVGGSGKTPLVREIAQILLSKGKKVVILSRGYGRNNNEMLWVNTENFKLFGDEVVMLKASLQIPIMVASKRMPAIQEINRKYNPDVIICDDGLQHRGLLYSKAILIKSEHKNKFVFPSGPMRCSESYWERNADLIIEPGMLKSRINGFTDSLGNQYKLLPNNNVTAIAGISQPERFFNMLKKLGYKVNAISFPDHHVFKQEELDFNATIVCTEKDAIKIPKEWGHYYVANYELKPDAIVLKCLDQWLIDLQNKGS